MNRKGFVLVETIIVLVVVIVSMLGLYKAYSFVFSNLKQNRYYDNINDIYKINVIKKTFTNGYPSSNYIKIESVDCTGYMSGDCTDLYTLLDIDYVIYNNINIKEVLSGTHTDLTNTDINYMKILQNNHKYLIIHYESDNKDYYASLSMKVIE